MKIYIDTNFKCHIDNPDGEYREIETSYFDGKCQTMIEGYRFVPEGESWVRTDGMVFQGEMVAPWKNYGELDCAQRAYEHQLLTQYETENTELKAQQNELITFYNEGVNSI